MGHGYQLKTGALSGQSDGYRSGSIEERAEELNALIRNPDVRCIMSTIGGSNSNSLLPYIDYEALTRDPKIIIGYSDATAILLAATLGQTWSPSTDPPWSHLLAVPQL